MHIYLDTKDLINILERSDPYTIDQLEYHLRQGGHKLVLSVYTVIELSAPLSHPTSKTNVMRLLNRLEKMPLCFIHASAIPHLELEEALQAFSTGREYRSIFPFVKRFDETVDHYGQPQQDFTSITHLRRPFGTFTHSAHYAALTVMLNK